MRAWGSGGGPLPATVGPFELVQPLARGGMGVVWRAVHPQQGVPVAIKVIEGFGETVSSELVQALEREVRAVAGLDHPHVIWVHDQGLVDEEGARALGGRVRAGSPWLAMELADAGSLSRERRAPRWTGIRRMLLALLDALGHAHARGVLHRDIKPANVLFQRDARGRRVLKLSDFGMGFAYDDPRAQPISGGTPLYMAPEQFTGEHARQGPWTDLYAVGCLAWRMVTHTTPFPRGRWRELARSHVQRPLPTFLPRVGVPEGLEAWLRRILAKRSNTRFQRAADAAWALAELGAAVPLQGSDDERPAPDAPTVLRPPVSLDAPTTTHPRFSVVLPAPGAEPVDGTIGGPPLPEDWRRPERERRSASLVGAGLGLYGLRPIPMVDREPERDAAWSALRRVHTTGRPHALVLRGPSGCGKSRLAGWLGRRAHEVGGATVLRATHNPTGGAGDGLGGLVARLLRVPVEADDETLSEALGLASERLGPWDDEARRRVAELLPGRAAAGMTAAERHVRTIGLLAAVARERPIVVSLDDVQWGADAVSFAQRLLESTDEVPALLVLTVQEEALAERPGARAALDALLDRCASSVDGVDIGPLAPAHRIELVQQLLGVSGEVAARVDARTAGNPLFAVQLVGDWVERGLLVPGDAGFELVPGAQIALPRTVHDVWGARIDRLLGDHGDAWAVPLELAGALGREVDRQEWGAVCAEADVTIPEGLVRRLLEQRLVSEEGARLVLAHSMLRECLVARAEAAGRLASHHRACVAMLQARSDPTQRERLGRHLLLAGDPEAALEPLQEGLDERVRRAEIVEALEVVALREAALVALDVPDDPRWVELWSARAQVLRLLGRLAEATTLARRAVVEGRQRGATRYLPQALRELAQLVLHTTGSEETEALLEEAVEIATAEGLTGELAGCRVEQARAAEYRGRYDEAADLYDRSRADYVAAADQRGEADALMGLGTVAYRQGRLDEAAERGRLARARYQALGTRWRLAWCDTLLGEVARYAGDLDAAERRYGSVIDQYTRLGARQTAVPRANLALVLCARERFAEAREAMEQAWYEAGRAGHGNLQVMLDVFLLEPLAALDDWEAFDEVLERAEAGVGEGQLVEQDLAASAERAAALADARDRPARARRVAALAAIQRNRLGST